MTPAYVGVIFCAHIPAFVTELAERLLELELPEQLARHRLAERRQRGRPQLERLRPEHYRQRGALGLLRRALLAALAGAFPSWPGAQEPLLFWRNR